MTAVPSAISPFVTEYSTETPYITLAEFLASPTALEVTDLIPGGTQAQQNRAMVDAIARASSWVDELCHQVLACTLNLERGRYRVGRDGYIDVPLRYSPVLEVRAVSMGSRASQLVALSSFSDVEVTRYGCRIPASAAVIAGFTPSTYKMLVDVTYVNGWVNALTSSATVAGATVLPLVNVLGIYSGTPLTVYDGANTEQVVVAPTYVPGNLNVPLVSAMQFAHTPLGMSVSNLPARVKQATILLTCYLIQTRGNDAIVLDAMETPGKSSAGSGASAEDLATAMDLLESFVRVK